MARRSEKRSENSKDQPRPTGSAVRQITRRAVRGARVQVLPGRLDRRVPERLLYELDRRAALEGVCCVGVTEPVWRYLRLELRPLRGRAHDAPDRCWIQPSAAARHEHGVARPGALGAQLLELAPGAGVEQNDARLGALAENGYLAGVAAGDTVT